jgi:hypothetical protein
MVRLFPSLRHGPSVAVPHRPERPLFLPNPLAGFAHNGLRDMATGRDRVQGTTGPFPV